MKLQFHAKIFKKSIISGKEFGSFVLPGLPHFYLYECLVFQPIRTVYLFDLLEVVFLGSIVLGSAKYPR